MAVGLISASAYAAEFKITGDAYVRGSTTSNLADNNTASTEATKSWYDMDFNLYPVIQVDKDTKIVLKLTVDLDTVPDKSPDTNYTDYYLNLENLYVSHTFQSTGTEILAGLFTGGTWGTSFGDTEYNAFRVRVNQKTPVGTLLAYLQKDEEKGSDTEKDQEKNDSDRYVVGALLKFGNFGLKPLIGYFVDGYNKEYGATGVSGEKKTVNIQVAADGKFGMLGFEADFIYNNFKDVLSGTTKYDYSNYGFYLGAYAELMKGTTVGAKYAFSGFDTYGTSATKSIKAVSFGDNFDPTLVVDDYIFGTAGSKGLSMLQVYADSKVSDALSVGASASLYWSNMDSNEYTTDDYGRFWSKDSKAWEVDLTASYAITKNLTYSVAAGYAKISDLYGSSTLTSKYDPSGAYRLFHKLAVKF